MRKLMTERQISGVGRWDSCELADAVPTSNAVLDELGSQIQWQYPYVAGDKTYCVYLAEDEELIRLHSEETGFPASHNTEIDEMIDPTATAE